MSMRRLLAVIMAAMVAIPAVASETEDAVARALEQVNRRLDALENQNRQLAARVEELTQQNQSLHAQNQAAGQAATGQSVQMPVSAAAAVIAKPAAPSVDDWTSRIRFNGDFRFRHESIDNELTADTRIRETIRAHLNAAVKITDSLRGEVGIGSGGLDPRGGSATLGAAESRKEIGLDLAYMSWKPIDPLTLTVGKMREPYVRPGRSLFFDNEIRPEGIAVNYKDKLGLFGTVFNFWLEERPLGGDSMLRGGQLGWDGAIDTLKLKVGAGYYDYVDVRGRYPGFANSLVSNFGNTISGSGTSAVYVYDYNIGQLFAEASLPIRGVPFSVFADYAHNFAADNGLDTAFDVGVQVGKATSAGQWEMGVMKQRMDKDALFGHWIDSDFAGGVTDNAGYLWRVGWMPIRNVLFNVIYMDSQFNVEVGNRADYDRWQAEVNFTF